MFHTLHCSSIVGAKASVAAHDSLYMVACVGKRTEGFRCKLFTDSGGWDVVMMSRWTVLLA